jgi:hypothetical protein
MPLARGSYPAPKAKRAVSFSASSPLGVSTRWVRVFLLHTATRRVFVHLDFLDTLAGLHVLAVGRRSVGGCLVEASISFGNLALRRVSTNGRHSGLSMACASSEAEGK